MENEKIINQIINDVNSMETALQVGGNIFYVEPIENHLEVYLSDSNDSLIFKDFDDLLENFVINGKLLKEQLDELDYA